MERIIVDVKVNPVQYIIYIGAGIIDAIIDTIAEEKYGKRYAIITDSKVKTLHAEIFAQKMRDRGIDTHLFDFPEGEIFKTRETKQMLDERLLESKLDRDAAIIAIGGGVVGVVAGLVAATFMRGIPYVQVPTTIIAQADSSIGGKTAIDYPQGKNLIGAFHHPGAVFMDIDTLSTLDDRNYRSGLVEIIKHGLIRDASLFAFFREHLGEILDREKANHSQIMVELMRKNCRIKNDVVREDQKEQNLRKILNYGHTIGHAIEHLSGYNLLHGEAVGIGIIAEAFFSYKLGFCSYKVFEEQANIIRQLKLPCGIPENISNQNIINTLIFDKKTREKKPGFVLLKRIGEVMLFDNGSTTKAIDEETIIRMLEDFRELK